MPRRPPPTALRLVEGPLPPRGKPKFTLPSVPRPVFSPPSMAPRGPVERSRPRTPDVTGMAGTPTPTTPPSTAGTTPSPSRSPIRGPWDHSRTISVVVDLNGILPAPMPVAMG
ncbi:hypothetical protein OF83DRAFT_1031610, partial [Amylostereum chailletii]